jgi:Domain of unknown function (DUF4136)
MRTLIIVVTVFFAMATVNAQKVKVTADPGVDISKYKTYAWAEPMPPGNPLVQQTIVAAVEQAMTAKGLSKVEEQPEITVTYFAAINTDIQISYPSWSSAMGTTLATGIGVNSQSWPVSKGTFVLDIADAQSKNTVWRGSANHTLEHGPTGNYLKDAKSVEKPIRKAVEKMFKQYPRPS